MPWKYNGVEITAQKRNGIDITMGKYNGVEFLATDPGGPLLADWTLPAGKQNAGGSPGQFLAEAGVGIGGYPKGMWMRTIEGTTGFGELQDGSFEFTFGGVTDTLDDIKFRDDGTNARMAVSRTTGTTFAHLSNWLSSLSGSEFMIQTANRTMRLPTDPSTDRSQGANWISWWLFGSGNANAMLTADDITELNRVRDNGERFLAGFIYNT